MDAESESLLVVVLDTNLSSVAASGGDPAHVLDSLLAFCNAHLMLSPSSQLCLIAAHIDQVEHLFPPELKPGQRAQGHYELFSQHGDDMAQRLRQMLLDRTPQPQDSAPVAAALAMSLCFINRVKRERPPQARLHNRVLVFTGSGTVAAQYMDFMNVFFTAQKLGIEVDACVVGGSDCGVLQQGADITGGHCMAIPASSVGGLLQYLLWVFLPAGQYRQQLALPAPHLVDYRAACFCHRHLVNVGFVCSVCLSIFCKFAPICSTCHTVFKVKGMALPKAPKKKKVRNGI